MSTPRLQYDYLGRRIDATSPLKAEPTTPVIQNYSSYFNPNKPPAELPIGSVDKKPPAQKTPTSDARINTINNINTIHAINTNNSRFAAASGLNTPRRTTPTVIPTMTRGNATTKIPSSGSEYIVTPITPRADIIKQTTKSASDRTPISPRVTIGAGNTPITIHTHASNAGKTPTAEQRPNEVTMNAEPAKVNAPALAKYTQSEITELLQNHFKVNPMLWDHLPVGSFIRYYKIGDEPAEERFRFGGYIKSLFMTADGVKCLLIESRRGCAQGRYYKYSIAMSSIEEIWKPLGGEAFIEIYMLQNSLLRKDREIAALNKTLVNLISRIEDLEKKIDNI